MDHRLFRARVKETQVLLLCEKFCGYRGLERRTPYAHNLFPPSLIKEMLYMVDMNGAIPYSHENFRRLHVIQEKLADKGLELDIILAGNSPNDATNYKFVNFLGYDISGESLCHSLIYRCFFDDLSLTSDKYITIINKLNQNGLFSNVTAAYEFINCIPICSHFFENDTNIEPVAIWELVF